MSQRPQITPPQECDSDSVVPLIHNPGQEWLLQRIESIFCDLIEKLLDANGELRLYDPSHLQHPNKALDAPSVEQQRRKEISYPGSSAHEAWRFTVLLRVLGLIHEAVASGVVVSKRDLFYQDPALFVRQAVVDRCVDRIAATFGVPRALLHVTAAAKGLFTGSLSLSKHDGSRSEGSKDREGLLIPGIQEVKSFGGVESVRWILVVEKEAVFRSLSGSSLWTTLSQQGVMATGKGYPDIATRAFLRHLALPCARNGYRTIPIYALVDFDPDGLAILSTYKRGSQALAHENAVLVVPTIRWLGIRSSDIIEDEAVLQSSAILRLTPRDRRKASSMLIRVTNDQCNLDGQLKRELQVMLALNVKAEIQSLQTSVDGICRFVSDRLGYLEATISM